MHCGTVSSNNITNTPSHTSNSGDNSTSDSETIVSITLQDKSKKIRKICGRGKRGKQLRNNVCNTIGHLRSCPPRTIRQANKIKYHRRISRIIAQDNFEESTSWKPNDLYCIACKTSVTGKKQLAQHFKSKKHKHKIWNCTPKYCAPCGIYHGFSTEQLWRAHISSRSHKSAISKLPHFKRQPNEYGFTN